MNAHISTQGVAAQATEFAQRLSSTRRGARLARRLAVQQLHDWGVPHGSGLSDLVAQVVAELAANAVTHGHVPGRDVELRLRLAGDGTVRVEVADARGDRRPVTPGAGGDAESGRGLRIVAALSTAWGVEDRQVGKTVWAELKGAG
ncbi:MULTISPECIES: ATP-binding protein [unclassified Streptomyces]|uniref:ATP-binding protein n=1 Tax=unclassified Streptomyces TaxID=2593676 RepID=UPI00225AAD4B|nr:MULTISPECIES: ATP-binding protein [unclassified Streptomyces]MCX5284888.1 ATP-binding protein [Streptomyces sp. NBC_00198]